MSAGAMIIRRQNRCIRTLRAAGATNRDGARRLDELGLRDSWIFRSLARRGVIRSANGDRWYLDEATAQQFLRVRRKRLFVFLLIALSLFTLYLVCLL